MPGNSLRERYTRPPSDRMRRVHDWISSAKYPNAPMPQYPNAVTLGNDLEVTDRTVKRDFEFMRDRYGLPIAYDDARHGYYDTPGRWTGSRWRR
jgi:proteasome accessory factor B